jgi:phage tail sheath gpL-like
MSGVIYNEIPAELQVPGTYVEIQELQQNPGLFGWPARAVLLGQKFSGLNRGANGVQGRIYTLTKPSDATFLGGPGSMIEAMAIAYFNAGNTIPVDAIMLNDPTGGTAATGAFAFSGTWTTGGTVPFYIGGQRVPVAVAVSDTVASFLANAAAAINAVPTLETSVAVGTGAQAGSLLVTANHLGVSGNDINLAVAMLPTEMLPSGMVCAITPMAGGAGLVSIASSIVAAMSTWYTDWACGWQDTANLQALAAELLRRSNAMVARDGVGYVTPTGSYATIMANMAAIDTQFISTLGVTNPVSTPWSITASLCGVAAQALTNDPSRQLRGLTLTGISSPWPTDRYLPFPTQELLLQAGISTYQVNADGTFAIQRLVTSQTTNAEGVPDPTWHDIMTVKVGSRIRYDWKVYRDNLYPRPKLVPDGSLAAQNDPTAVTPKRMQSSWAARCRVYGSAGWIDNIDATVAQANFTINPNDHNRMDGNMPIQVSGNLMVLASVLQVSN